MPDTVYDQVVETVPHVIVATFVPGYGELLDLSVMFGRGYSWTDRGLAAISLIGGVISGGWSPNVGPAIRAARGGSRYPGKAGKIEHHHVAPKYLGGDPKGITVPIDAAYHQEITNAFRAEWGYGKGIPSDAQRLEIMRRVYEKFPLPEK